MADGRSARLALPLLAAGQAQKEMTVNEALTQIDLAVQSSVVAAGLDEPPAAPSAGQCWIVGTSPVGAWTGQAGNIAGWTDGGWRFVAPIDGMAVWVASAGLTWRWSGGAWDAGTVAATRITIGGVQVVGTQAGAIAPPSGGSVVDVEARATVAQIVAAMAAHGLIAG